jgi:hypothetical protein
VPTTLPHVLGRPVVHELSCVGFSASNSGPFSHVLRSTASNAGTELTPSRCSFSRRFGADPEQSAHMTFDQTIPAQRGEASVDGRASPAPQLRNRRDLDGSETDHPGIRNLKAQRRSTSRRSAEYDQPRSFFRSNRFGMDGDGSDFHDDSLYCSRGARHLLCARQTSKNERPRYNELNTNTGASWAS